MGIGMSVAAFRAMDSRVDLVAKALNSLASSETNDCFCFPIGNLERVQFPMHGFSMNNIESVGKRCRVILTPSKHRVCHRGKLREHIAIIRGISAAQVWGLLRQAVWYLKCNWFSPMLRSHFQK